MSSIGASAARCAALTMSAAVARRLRRRSAASSAGRRCATGEQAPTAMRAASIAPVVVRLDHARDHDDRDHQIAPRAELEEIAARAAAALGHEQRGDDLVGAAERCGDSR